MLCGADVVAFVATAVMAPVVPFRDPDGHTLSLTEEAG
jgi:hypothetical protein